MLPYEAIVNAFKSVDPKIKLCQRGGNPGYLHIHGPNERFEPQRRHSAWIVVEKSNGSVFTQKAVGKLLKFNLRPIDPARGVGVPIRLHPLGSSHKLNYGKHKCGLTFGDIKQRWPNLSDFAREMIETCRAFTVW